METPEERDTNLQAVYGAGEEVGNMVNALHPDWREVAEKARRAADVFDARADLIEQGLAEP